MLKAKVYSIKGEKLPEISLPKIFVAKVNLPLLAQAVHVYRDRMHFGLAKTKTRAEINRTKKKWYKQKGTGGARHGARSAPIFVGGGTAHGPKLTRRELTLPLKIKQQALSSALSFKLGKGELVVVNGLTNLKKTKEAQKLIDKIVSFQAKNPKTARLTFVLSDSGKDAEKFLKNIKDVRILFFRQLNAYDVFYGGLLIFDKNIFAAKKAEVAKKSK